MKDRNSAHYLKKLYLLSCLEELKALKPGNVNIKSILPGLKKNKFFRAAKISSEKLTDVKLSLGESIYYSCKDCLDELRTNYNLGIILLCAPVIRASMQNFNTEKEFIYILKQILIKIDLKDTKHITDAIKISKPAGIKNYHSRGNIFKDNSSKLSFYETNYSEIFNDALPYFQYQKKKKCKFPVERLFLKFLSKNHDSHILRKFGFSRAQEIRYIASKYFKKTQKHFYPNEQHDLNLLDKYLKRKYVNPGTCADLTVTTLLIDKIMDIVKYSNYDIYT